MRTYPLRVPRLLQAILPKAHFRLDDSYNHQYALTFDDGPHPVSTPILLRLLDDLGLKVRFFVLGSQAAAHPSILSEMISEGHHIGSHGYDHLNGWQTDTQVYIDNVNRASQLLASNVFRPPFGKISRTQYKRLKDDHQLYLWSLMPGDFDPNIDAARVHRRMTTLLRQKDVVVLHDSPDAVTKLQEVLPDIVQELRDKGLRHKCL